jgi:hypothetical protein
LPVKSETALRVVAPLLEEPVANRPNWTIARMPAEIEAREGITISRSQLSKALRKKRAWIGAPPVASETGRAILEPRGATENFLVDSTPQRNVVHGLLRTCEW